ncbi:oligosaccharide flippase family protein [Marinicrinis lubricantis]|uniref:Oligosaccharide flippase family protein n=1 Tax=Marinicrinis lubricantis TaxID=2086470 RepID=A0ABW1IUW3_9BACL
MAKDSLIKGTVILAAAALVARFLGLIQRIPLQNMLGDEGSSPYGVAYNVYFMLLIVATAGIPSALSKMVSEKLALEQVGEARRIYRAAVMFAVTAGVVITAVLMIGAPFYAEHIANNPESALSIQALAPAMLLFPLIAMMRGYFQGHQQMMPGGLSQIFEQILRVATAVLLAFVILRLGYSKEWAAAGASFGGVAGAVGAFVVMLYYQRKLNKEEKAMVAARAKSESTSGSAAPMPFKEIYRAIFKLSVPISLISMAVPLVYFIDSSIVIRLLKGSIGLTEATEALGVLTMRAQSIAGIPPIVAIALSTSIVPVVSAAYAKKDQLEVNHKASQALRISIISGLPIVIAMGVAARPLNGLLFQDLNGTGIIFWMIIGSIFQIMMMTSASILMGLGQTRAPMWNVFVGIIVKLAGSFLLAPFFGMNGIIWSTTLCFLVTMILNLQVLKKTVNYRVLGKRWKGYILTTMLITAAGFGVEWLTHEWLHTGIRKLDYLLAGGITGGMTLLLYPVLLGMFRALTLEDIQMLPGKIRRRIEPLAAKWLPKEKAMEQN